jgi:hypothetical protein
MDSGYWPFLERSSKKARGLLDATLNLDFTLDSGIPDDVFLLGLWISRFGQGKTKRGGGSSEVG